MADLSVFTNSAFLVPGSYGEQMPAQGSMLQCAIVAFSTILKDLPSCAQMDDAKKHLLRIGTTGLNWRLHSFPF